MKGVIATLTACLFLCTFAWANDAGSGGCSVVMTGGGQTHEHGSKQASGWNDSQDAEPARNHDSGCACHHESKCGKCDSCDNCGACGKCDGCGSCGKSKCSRCQHWGCDRMKDIRCSCEDECGRRLDLVEDSPIKPPIPHQAYTELDPNCCPREEYCLVCCPRAEFKLLCCAKKCGCEKCEKPCKPSCGCDDCADRQLLDLRNN